MDGIALLWNGGTDWQQSMCAMDGIALLWNGGTDWQQSMCVMDGIAIYGMEEPTGNNLAQ